jgi:T5SS/PEP-CTERM-associated repeat protein
LGTGTLTVSDAGSLITGTAGGGARFIVGAQSVGTLNIDSGGKVTAINPVDIGQTASGKGAIAIDGAGSSLTATSVATRLPGELIDGDAGTGDLKITNSGSASFSGQNVLGAQTGAVGTLEVQSGGAAIFDEFLNLGFLSGATGNATITGAKSALTVTGALNVGDGGAGELDVLAGAKASVLTLTGGVNYMALGGSAGASGVVLVDGTGSELDIASDLTVGVAGQGKVTVSDGAVLNDSGGLSSGAQATISVLSGGDLIVGDALQLAQGAGSKATLTVSASVSAASLAVGAAGGGVAGVTIDAGGSVSVASAEVQSGDTISLAGGQLTTNPLIIDVGGLVSGYGKIDGSITNQGGVTASGGALDVTGDVGGALTIDQGASLELGKAVITGASIQFASGGGETLTLDDTSGYAASQITGFVAGDKIDLVGFSYSGPSTVVLGPTDVLALAPTSGPTLDLAFDSNDIGAEFTISSDNAGGVFVTDNLACFARGALIQTMNGEVAVEDLTVGDCVVLARGGLRPIVWMGHRRLDTSRHPAPEKAWPVRIEAGAFGEGLPRRDLWLSPGHYIAVDGVLMPICVLINGHSVVQVAQERFEYWHVELNAHDVILANGLPAESYLDTGNRTGFSNWGAFVEAHPDFEPRHWAETCLPLVLEGPMVAAAKAKLLARLAKLGRGMTRDADAHISVDGHRVEPIRLSETKLAFVLHAGGREIALRLRTFIPAHTVVESSDPRALGLCVAALQIDGEPISLADEAACASGWHEGGSR